MPLSTSRSTDSVHPSSLHQGSYRRRRLCGNVPSPLRDSWTDTTATANTLLNAGGGHEETGEVSSVYQAFSEAAPIQEEVEDIGICSTDRVQQRQQFQDQQYEQKWKQKGNGKKEEEEAEHFDLDVDPDNSRNSNNDNYDNNEAYIFDPIFVQQFSKMLRLGLLFETVRALGLEEELVSNNLLSCGNCNCDRYSDSFSTTSSHIAADAAAGLGHGVAVLREGPARQVTIVENPAGRVEESRGEFVGFKDQEDDTGVQGDEEGPNDDDDIWDTEYDEELWRARERRNGICLSDEEALQLRRFLGIE